MATKLYCKHCIHYDICRNENLYTQPTQTHIDNVSKGYIFNIACSAYRPSPQKEIIDLLKNISDKLSILIEKNKNEEEL